MTVLSVKPRVIVGLGNPGPKFSRTRHNIGFEIVDQLAARHGGQWHSKDIQEVATIHINGNQILLIKPQTFMNNSGEIVTALKKSGIEPAQVLVAHDELELPFGKIALKLGGSAKGHNGLKSLIERFGSDGFARLRFGIGRPAQKEDVPNYVLENFSPAEAVNPLVEQAAELIESLY